MSYVLPKSVKASDVSRAYIIWQGMIARCCVKSNTSYPGYGERGIKVCNAWKKDFDAFISDMGIPERHESIDRIDTFGNYTPRNCRWATALQQGRNRRDSLKLSHKGVTKTLRQWSEETSIKYHTLRYRMRQGLTPEGILSLTDRRKERRCS